MIKNSPLISLSSKFSSGLSIAIPSKRWIVDEGNPVSSFILLAARPVGAAKTRASSTS